MFSAMSLVKKSVLFTSLYLLRCEHQSAHFGRCCGQRYTDKDGLKRTKKNMSRQSVLKSAGMSSTGCGLKGHQLSSFFKMLQFVINWPRTFLDRNPGLQVSQKGLPAGDDMMELMGYLRMSQG